jgi:hypothetical protein
MGYERAFKAYQRNAKRKRISFSLTLEEFQKLTEASCTFCGLQPSNGVDRKDSRCGYYIENSQPCCKFCNRLKSDFLQPVWLSQILRISDYVRSMRSKKNGTNVQDVQ